MPSQSRWRLWAFVGLGWAAMTWGALPEAMAWKHWQPRRVQQPLRWNKMPIRYAIDAAGLGDFFPKNPRYGAPGSEFDAVEASFKTWASIYCPSGGQVGLRFEFMGRVTGKSPGADYNCDDCNTNLIAFYRDPNTWRYPSQALAVTEPAYRRATGQIIDMDILINAAHLRDYIPTTQTKDSAMIKRDIQSVVTHEIGHLLGLDHSEVAESTMYASQRNGELKRDLHADDVAGICSIYPPTTAGPTIPKYKQTGQAGAIGCQSAPGMPSFGWWLLVGWGLALGFWRRKERRS